MLWIDNKSEFVTFNNTPQSTYAGCGLTTNLSLLHSNWNSSNTLYVVD